MNNQEVDELRKECVRLRGIIDRNKVHFNKAKDQVHKLRNENTILKAQLQAAKANQTSDKTQDLMNTLFPNAFDR